MLCDVRMASDYHASSKENQALRLLENGVSRPRIFKSKNRCCNVRIAFLTISHSTKITPIFCKTNKQTTTTKNKQKNKTKQTKQKKNKKKKKQKKKKHTHTKKQTLRHTTRKFRLCYVHVASGHLAPCYLRMPSGHRAP